VGASMIMDDLEQPESERMSEKVLREGLLQVLKGHFRPEFLNRIDEVIVFHALTRENIREIVRLQLDRVVRTAAAQRIALQVDDSLVDHLAGTGYRPEFGARELKRQIRLEVETLLAREILGETLKSGNAARLVYDPSVDQVAVIPVESPARTKPKAKKSKADEQVPDVA